MKYLYDEQGWPEFFWDADSVAKLLAAVRYDMGRLVGTLEALTGYVRDDAMFNAMVNDVLKSSEIEGEKLDLSQVRSSVARRMGLSFAGAVPSDRHVDGVVQMMLDATQNASAPLTENRLFDWHAALFPTGRSGMFKIDVACYRKDLTGPMQVVSGAMGKETVHFQAPAAKYLNKEMAAFLKWFNASPNLDLLLKASLAHLWFLTLHPFDDGNGRMARALSDLLLTRADGTNRRYYSMSAQIRKERKAYYTMLERTQKGNLDVTPWMLWFLHCLHKSVKAAALQLNEVLHRSKFWQQHQDTPLNTRQSAMINKLTEGFRGKLTTSKWAKMCMCSHDTALRDVNDLVSKGVLRKEESGGRSTSYSLAL